MLPKTSFFFFCFFIKNKQLLKKCNSIWNKVNNIMKKKLDYKPIYNKDVLKTKIRSHSDDATVSHSNEIPEADSNYTFLSSNINSFCTYNK